MSARGTAGQARAASRRAGRRGHRDLSGRGDAARRDHKEGMRP